jgi:hypothetical protein
MKAFQAPEEEHDDLDGDDTGALETSFGVAFLFDKYRYPQHHHLFAIWLGFCYERLFYLDCFEISYEISFGASSCCIVDRVSSLHFVASRMLCLFFESSLGF